VLSNPKGCPPTDKCGGGNTGAAALGPLYEHSRLIGCSRPRGTQFPETGAPTLVSRAMGARSLARPRRNRPPSWQVMGCPPERFQGRFTGPPAREQQFHCLLPISDSPRDRQRVLPNRRNALRFGSPASPASPAQFRQSCCPVNPRGCRRRDGQP
jgi:hypothetical protein